MNIIQKIFPLPDFEAFAKEDRPFFLAQVLVRIFYYFLLYASIQVFFSWDVSFAAQTRISPFWATRWMEFVSFPVAYSIIRFFFITSAFFAALFPTSRIMRALAFVGILEFISLFASILRADVDWYVWVVTAFLLIFLPNDWSGHRAPSALSRQKFLLVFWTCQAFLLLTYSMAGIGKIYGVVKQVSWGQVHSFAPSAAALQTADRLLQMNSISPLGSWLVNNYLVAWPLFAGSILFMLVAFWVAFWPQLHRPWAIGLILFHIFSYLAMNIGFTGHIFLESILFLYSPFSPARASWLQLPLLGGIISRFKRRNA